jgi:P-type Cu2+ transporter
MTTQAIPTPPRRAVLHVAACTGPPPLLALRSDPLDVPTALMIGRGTLRKMHQNLGWAVGTTPSRCLSPPAFSPDGAAPLRPEIAALSMPGSSIIVAVNALLLKRLRLPAVILPEPAPSRS